MQPQPASPASCWRTHAGERETALEDSDSPPSPVDDPANSPLTGEHHGSPNTPEPVPTDPRKRQRQRFRRARARSQRECRASLMSELAFSSTTTNAWKELDFGNPESTQRKKRKRGECGRVESEEDSGKKKKKHMLRPNFFVSIPITNSKISEGVAEVQEAVLQKEPRLSKAMIPIGSLHITLLVTHLADQEQIDLAVGALSQMEEGVSRLLGGQGLSLPFAGIGSFRNEVAFVELVPGGHVLALETLADLTRKVFQERGLSPGDGRDFKPHLTFMKLSRSPKLRSQGIKKLDPELYASFSHQMFGEERVARLDLCSMLKKKTPDGYYHREASVCFDLFHSTPRARTSVKKGAELDDGELQRISRKLVEEAVLRAVQQYKDETQQPNGGGPNEQATPPTTTSPAITPDNIDTPITADATATVPDSEPSK